MKVVSTVKEMQSLANEARGDGKTISFVPTMGALHDGHLKLISEGRERGDVLVLSIFVNPTQFGRGEDLNKYPQDLDGDLDKIKGLKVDVVFTPTVEEMYPEGFQTYVVVEELEKHLCGPSRPGHFRGVATVVLKLFNTVKPHVALFGEKDYQQLKVIERMVKDLNLEVQIVGFPTVRDKNGLALSSRNSYLSAREGEKAVSVSKALREVKKRFNGGVRDTRTMIKMGKIILGEVGITDVDYLEVCDSETLERKEFAESGDLVAVAVRLGGTRLIDNTRL